MKFWIATAFIVIFAITANIVIIYALVVTFGIVCCMLMLAAGATAQVCYLKAIT